MTTKWQEYLDNLYRHFLDWAPTGRCKDKTSDLYPPSEKGQLEAIKKYCNDCKAKLDCAVYALATEEAYGVWGGTTESQRREAMKSLYSLDLRPAHRLHTIRKLAVKLTGNNQYEKQTVAKT